jgi:hypothetical protein
MFGKNTRMLESGKTYVEIQSSERYRPDVRDISFLTPAALSFPALRSIRLFPCRIRQILIPQSLRIGSQKDYISIFLKLLTVTAVLKGIAFFGLGFENDVITHILLKINRKKTSRTEAKNPAPSLADWRRRSGAFM